MGSHEHHEGHVTASQLCSEVFSASAPWFTPPADLIDAVMTVLTLPPASLSLSFSHFDFPPLHLLPLTLCGTHVFYLSCVSSLSLPLSFFPFSATTLSGQYGLLLCVSDLIALLSLLIEFDNSFRCLNTTQQSAGLRCLLTSDYYTCRSILQMEQEV